MYFLKVLHIQCLISWQFSTYLLQFIHSWQQLIQGIGRQWTGCGHGYSAKCLIMLHHYITNDDLWLVLGQMLLLLQAG